MSSGAEAGAAWLAWLAERWGAMPTKPCHLIGPNEPRAQRVGGRYPGVIAEPSWMLVEAGPVGFSRDGPHRRASLRLDALVRVPAERSQADAQRVVAALAELHDGRRIALDPGVLICEESLVGAGYLDAVEWTDDFFWTVPWTCGAAITMRR